MRVCFVLASWEAGGLERHAVELANALSEHCEVSVIAHHLMTGQFSDRIQFHGVDMSRSRWSVGLHRDLWQILAKGNYDVIHAQANKAAALVGRLRPLLPKKVALVASMHNQKANLGVFSHFDHLILGGSIGLLSGRTLNIPVTSVYNGMVPTGAADWTRERLCATFALDPERPVFCAVGRFVPAKGFDILIPALAAANAQCLLIGDGDERSALEKLAQEHQAHVVFAGYRQDAMSLLAVADGMLISSRNEGFAYVFVEGLLARRPIIATALPMVDGFLPPEVVVAVDAIEPLAEKIRWAITHADDWQQLMQPFWQHAEQQLTLQSMVNNTQRVYQAAIQARQ